MGGFGGGFRDWGGGGYGGGAGAVWPWGYRVGGYQGSTPGRKRKKRSRKTKKAAKRREAEEGRMERQREAKHDQQLEVLGLLLGWFGEQGIEVEEWRVADWVVRVEDEVREGLERIQGIGRGAAPGDDAWEVGAGLWRLRGQDLDYGGARGRVDGLPVWRFVWPLDGGEVVALGRPFVPGDLTRHGDGHMYKVLNGLIIKFDEIFIVVNGFCV